MQLLTKDIERKLRKNGEAQKIAQAEDRALDFFPVVKLFTPDAGATWLLTELDPDDPDIAFGLCDLGLGFPELGTVSLTELREVRGRLGLPVERDLSFKAERPLSSYAADAEALGHIA
ncbi:DUF2958 domain-containing protein [Accumulibacter sp.]|uniref:DUF2958 domain-containing protein n=1 Tax=Accumulibacter sp. TaxID=2053492 RepID=UPI00287B3018|nr:DUF2958 domain-containing protein [Accumulibacter sp.]MDS4055361.1 DUF2958 domain-containing protein [Accumulibacter sp.]